VRLERRDLLDGDVDATVEKLKGAAHPDPNPEKPKGHENAQPAAVVAPVRRPPECGEQGGGGRQHHCRDHQRPADNEGCNGQQLGTQSLRPPAVVKPAGLGRGAPNGHHHPGRGR
jgi:hypothetical protein